MTDSFDAGRSAPRDEDGRAERVVGPDDVARVITRLAHDINDRSLADERGPLRIDPSTLSIVGVRTGGAHLAERLATELATVRGERPDVGLLDITLYRDDVLVGGAPHLPVLRGTEIPFDIEGRYIVLVDDVLYTGRTVRAALGALLDLGRPASVRLAVLVDRGLRELPIAADFVGRTLGTEPTERVEMRLREMGHDEDEVVLITPTNRRSADRGDRGPGGAR